MVCRITIFYSKSHKEASVLSADYVTHPEHMKANTCSTNEISEKTQKKRGFTAELNPAAAVTPTCCIMLSLAVL